MTDILFPRVMSIRDQISVPVSITVTDERVREVKLSLSAEGPVSVSGPSEKSVQFDRPGEKKVFFELSGKSQLGAAALKLQAKSGSFRSDSRVDFYLDNPNPVSRKVREYWVEPGKSISVSVDAFGMAGTRSVELSVSTFAGKSLEDMKDELVRYPHGCAEQVTSAAFAQIRLENLMELDAASRAEIRNNVIQGISKLQRFQKNNGGFSYWDQDTEVADYVSSYVGHFLLEARKAGFSVPEDMIARWKEYQQGKARSYESRKSEYGSYLEYNQAYRLYTLALAGVPDWTSMNQLSMRKDRAAMPSWILAGAYALAGKNDLATKLLTGLPDQIQPYSESFWHYGSDIRDEAIIALVLYHLNRTQDAANMIRKVFRKIDSGSYLSTQEMAMLLVTSGKIWQKSPGENAGMEFSYNWAAKKKDVKTGYSVFASGLEDVLRSDLSFTNRSSVPVAVQLVQRGKPENQSPVNESNILQMQISYTDELGKPVNLSAVPQSAKLQAKVRITHNGTAGHLRNLALTAAFPACFEINNQRIGGVQVVNPKVRNTDYRDDRVMYYFDLGVKESLELSIPLVASAAGTFQSPDFYAEAMYEPSVRARVNRGPVKVLTNASE
jgi:uncharacterized protein YfaS (alpha-2-macroglobulin family)